MHMREILVAQEGWNSVNISTQLYIDVRYEGSIVFPTVKKDIILEKPEDKH